MFSKKTPYVISIPTPCQQNWDGMALAERGRHCAACSTIVTDFTGLSDAEIINELQRTSGKLCGRFAESQLNRELVANGVDTAIRRQRSWSKIAASVLLFHAFISQVSGQQKSTPVTQHVSNNQRAAGVKNTPADTTNIVIKGKLLNYHNNQPLKGLEVEIKGTVFKGITDNYGHFKFELPDYYNEHEIVIGLSDSAAEFLDTTASFVPDVKLTIDSLPFKRTVNLWRYPSEKIPVSEIVTPSTRLYTGQIIARQVDVIPTERLTALPSPALPPKKETTLQKLRKFFLR